jgi:uncharacterized protein (DUF885 family)
MHVAKYMAVTLALASAPAHADASADLKKLVDDYWTETLKLSPLYAFVTGEKTDKVDIGDNSLDAKDRFAKTSADFLSKVEKISTRKLSPAERIEHGILRRTLQETIEANRFGQRAINFSTYSGWHQNFAAISDQFPFRDAADYKIYNDLLTQYPKVNEQSLAVADKALKGGYVLPCVALEGYEKGVAGLKPDNIRDSRYFKPYRRTKPANISDEEWTKFVADAEATIGTIIYPAVQKHLDWYLQSYKPVCAQNPSVSAQPGGREYYDFRIRQETTTTRSADDIHNLGLSEVARIRTEMVEVAKQAGYDSREAFIQHLRTDPQHYAKTPEELMEKVARVTKTIDGKMPMLFKRLPRLPYGLKEIPAEIAEKTTTAYYNPGAPAVGIAGFYFVNTSKLDQRPLWEIPALSVHEAVPGHHHQIALQQELELSNFRKHGVSFTAFVEGWGLYSERLGIEMGLYDTPAKDMGRLSYEMWRATRLVVDTGIHAKGWSKQQAIDFMTDNTALSAANIEAEVNRYISWPGQALAYKIGELKIRELRELATTELGAKFDLAAFHDTVLGQGAVPLDVLELMVKDWILAEKAKN